MYCKKAILAVLVSELLAIFNVKGQNTNVNSWEDILEEVSSDEEDKNWDDEIEELSQRIQEPINLNSATKEQLEEFPFLNDKQIENILAYVYIDGPMQTLYELQLVYGMDRKTIQYLIPFVCTKPIEKKEPLPNLKKILSRGKNELLTRFDIPFYTRKGYQSSYLGPSIYHSLRYRFHYKENIYWGITAEKDAGEPFFARHNIKGYDYYSFYFFIKNIRNLKALALGNYRLSFGQGLIISNNYLLGKRISASTVGMRSGGVKKHSSTDEYNYFHGVAATVAINRFTLSSFYSHRSMDGIITDDSITSITKTGLHRTEKEASRRNAFTMQMMGSNLTYSKNAFRLGITGIYYFFNKLYEPQIREYSKYNIRGNKFYNIGFDYRYRRNRFDFSGELGLGKSGGIAMLNIIRYSPSENSNLVLIHRYYAYNYWAMYARSFSEGGAVQNENGWYLAGDITPFRYWKFFCSIDFFSFPWLKYGVDKPSSGFDGLLQTTYSPYNNLSMYLRCRYKLKEKNYRDEDKIKRVLPLHHYSFRYQLNYSVSDHLALKTVVDYNVIYPQGVKESRGLQLAETLSYTFHHFPLKCGLHGVWFHTDDYSSRTYSYERGMLYSFSIPSFYGRGTRLAVNTRYDIDRKWMILAKIGQTKYNDRDQIGSGKDVIDSNKKIDFQMQVRYKF